jgi:DNA-binding response OmpR family regulator
LILDILMPGLDGFEILAQMRSWGVQDGTRTLVLSARTADKDRARALELGADLFVAKPFDPDELAEAVKELIALTSEGLREWRARGSRDVAGLLSGR